MVDFLAYSHHIVISAKDMEILKTPAALFMNATAEKLEKWKDEPR